MYGYLDYSLTQNRSERITAELKVQANLTREFLLASVPESLNYDMIDAFRHKALAGLYRTISTEA